MTLNRHIRTACPFDCSMQCTCTATFRSLNLKPISERHRLGLPLQLHPLKGASTNKTRRRREYFSHDLNGRGLPKSASRQACLRVGTARREGPTRPTRLGNPRSARGVAYQVYSFATGLGRGVCSSSSSPLSEPPSGACATRGHSTGTTAGTLPPVRRSTWWLKTSGRCTKRLDGSYHREPTL